MSWLNWKIVLILAIAAAVLLLYVYFATRAVVPTGPLSTDKRDLSNHLDLHFTDGFPPSVEVARPSKATSDQSPVLFYFPAWPGFQIDNSLLIDELASHGYVVISLSYPAKNLDRKKSDLASRLLAPMDFSSASAFEETRKNADIRLKKRVADAEIVYEWLTTLDVSEQTKFFNSPLNLMHVGAFGYSFGGAVAAELCRYIEPVKVAVNLDGWLFGESVEKGVPCDYLAFSDGSNRPSTGDLNSEAPEKKYMSELTEQTYVSMDSYMPKFGGVFIKLKGSGHTNFSDSQWHSIIRTLGWPGRVSAKTATLTVNRYVLAFLDKTIHKNPSTLVSCGAERDKAIELKIWPKCDE